MINSEFIDSLVSTVKGEISNEHIEIMSPDYDKDSVESSVRSFYRYMNKGVDLETITWVSNPFEAQDIAGKDCKIHCSYFNFNWVFFFKKFYDGIENGSEENKEELLEQYKDDRIAADYAMNIMKNSFGIVEIKDVDIWKEIILIEKPSNIGIENDELHSLTGPAFSFESTDKLTFYFIKGVKFEEELFFRVMKSAISYEVDDLNKLGDEDMETLKNNITKFEEKNGVIDTKIHYDDLNDLPNKEIISELLFDWCETIEEF